MNNELRALPYDECRRLLASRRVGRVAVCTPDGPHLVPVNYALNEESVVFRTTPFSVLGTFGWDQQLAFEVDEVDDEGERGWSVVAAGMGTLVEDDEEVAVILGLGDPMPWVGGERMLYIRLRWSNLSGRLVGAPCEP